VLRLGLDPCEDVAKLGERIINYIFELAAKISEARQRTLKFKQNNNTLGPMPVMEQPGRFTTSVNGPPPSRLSTTSSDSEHQLTVSAAQAQGRSNPVSLWQMAFL
jgi:hypothetical protein